MERYNSIIVGSGISGLTLALLLAANGRKVLLLEKAPIIGGCLSRFYKKGVPFDTGFHFTGGFVKNRIMEDMLRVLGIRDSIHPILLDKERSNRFIFENEGLSLEMPAGLEQCCAKLENYFPAQRVAIRNYFEMVERVIQSTPSFDLRKISFSPEPIEEDYISLQKVLDSLTQNQTLKAALSVYCMCYGTKPSEISFANHARVSIGFYDCLTRIKDGGEAFIRAFSQAFKNYPIMIRCNTTIQECLDIHDGIVGRVLLSDGEEVAFDECIFTIHPFEVLKIIPKQHFSKAFWERVESFEPSNGFFSVFGAIEGEKVADNFEPSIVSLLPHSDINILLDPKYIGPQALAIFQSLECAKDKTFHVLNAFEPSFFEQVAPWSNSKVGHRPQGYTDYKKQRVQSICNRIQGFFPEYKDSFRMYDAASMLTFRDYLFSPDGSAYGIKQKVGQFNLFGKLPLRNLYTAGQSAVLPGILGAMLSSFVIARALVDKDAYNNFINKSLCP
ncbi:MAG: NAD(P)/FAD-dependent oxidoreductase [Candidatus Omnitrophica bacterium]|nr:NAD(P)/FAD-dependent oxidoreductase [Candidatus Omnitrophota bacterium]